MRTRVLLTSALVTVVCVGATWLTLQPLLARAERGAQWREPARLVLGLDLALGALVVFGVLQVSFGRAARRLERAAAPLVGDAQVSDLAQLERALRRLSTELGDERGVSQRRFDELKTSHDALSRLQAELVAADRLATVGKLAAGVAHEVGNPLSGILGYLSVLRMRLGDNAEVMDLVARIEREVQRIDGIVRSLLELGRPSRGKAQPLDVRPLVDSCVQLLAAGREFQNVRVTVEGPPALWLRAEAGPLSQVLVNLLINGAQAMGGAGELTVRLEPGRRVVVDDRGPGLSAEGKARLFTPFFTTRPAGQGTGLGLAVSRHLLAQFEGALEAGDAPGGGARFIVTLPTP